MLKKIFFLITLLAAINSYAYEPFLTDDASTTEKGSSQIELYYYRVLDKPDPNAAPGLESLPGEEFVGSSIAKFVPFSYTYGVTENIEATFGVSYYNLPTGNYSRFANYVLSAKYRFYGDGENGWNFAIRPSISLPNSTSQQEDGLGMALPGYGLAAIGSYYADRLGIYFNLSYLHQPYNTNYLVGQSNEDLRKDLYQLSVAPIYELTPEVHLGFDFGLLTNISKSSEYSYNYFVMPAVMYTPRKDIDLGISYLIVSGTLQDELLIGPYSHTFKLGLTYRF
jgi:hypothetical protein